MIQMELGYYPENTVRQILVRYATMKAETVTGETSRDDYRCRVGWLIEVLGETTPAEAVKFSRLEEVARSARGLLRDVTIKRRLTFWRSAVRYAAQREVVPWEVVPELPPWLRDDSVRCDDYYTEVQFQAFRLALAPGRFRRFADLGMWTGQHTHDLCSMARWMLEPDFEWTEAGGAALHFGRWWRRNHKTRRCKPAWMPMEPELRELARELLREPGHPDGLLVGPVNNLRRAVHAAAARADLPPIRANLGLRASHATMLMARGYPYEYVRQVLGHEGEVKAVWGARGDARPQITRPTMLTRHYLRPSPGILLGTKRRG